MIIKGEWQEFEVELMRREKPDIYENLRIVDALYEEAVALGVLPPKDPLEGLDVAIRIAKAVNSVPRAA